MVHVGPGIATVSTNGLLQTLAPGSVLVSATIDGVAGSLSLTVVPRTVAAVTVSSPTSTPKEGDTVQLTATARDQFGNVIPEHDRDVVQLGLRTWPSSRRRDSCRPWPRAP